MNTLRKPVNLLSLAIIACTIVGAVAASAVIVPITWLDQSPTAFGSPVPNGAIIPVAGVGNVTVTYSIPAHWTHSRLLSTGYTAGSVTFGPDTYSWTNFESFATIFTPGLLGPEVGTITYTFASTLPDTAATSYQRSASGRSRAPRSPFSSACASRNCAVTKPPSAARCSQRRAVAALASGSSPRRCITARLNCAAGTPRSASASKALRAGTTRPAS